MRVPDDRCSLRLSGLGERTWAWYLGLVRKKWLFVLVWLALAGAVGAPGATVEGYAKRVSSLVDPAKLATLGKRGANPRVQKYVAILADARAAGVRASNVRVAQRRARRCCAIWS